MSILIVTTAYKTSVELNREGRELADKLKAPFLVRGKKSLADLQLETSAEKMLVISKNGLTAHTEAGELFFHLSMAELRLKNIRDGKPDHMAAAMALQPGMSVLDCTLGLGTDAIVSSYLTGTEGTVKGLEASPVIALLVKRGLSTFQTQTDILTLALRRIQVENIDNYTYLASLPAQSWDVVYFDPMFRQPVYRSSALKPIRNLADKRELSFAAVKEACRVAKKRVVIKETKDSPEFSRLGCTTIVGGKYSRVHYGIIDCLPPQRSFVLPNFT